MATPLAEQETIINYNPAGAEADVYTHDRAWQKHIESLGIKPYFKQNGAREYRIPRAWLRKPRKPSEKRREASRRLVKARGGRIGKTLVSAGAKNAPKGAKT